MRGAMRGDVTGVYTRLGLATFKVRQPARLRFCPDCLDDMEADHADLWWRREHQLAGIPVCSIHGTVLRHSDVSAGERNRHSFFAASREVCRTDAALAVEGASSEDMARLAELAVAAAGLLDAPPDPMDHGGRHDAYRRRAADVGLMRSAHRIDVVALHGAFRHRWGGVTELIAGLELGDDPERSWLTSMLRSRARAVHPLQHLMLAVMLDGLDGIEVDQPFGGGPWECRNPVVDHAGQPMIGTVAVRRDRDIVYGDFQCGCGYLYTVAKDRDGKVGQPRYRRFGPTFAPALRAALSRGESLRATAKALRLDPKTLMREAAMAGVEVPWTTKASGALPARDASAPTAAAPARATRKRRPRRNWFAIDTRLARSARMAAASIRTARPPVRVTHAEVERRIARRDWIVKRSAKLPRTVATIAELAEPVDAFRRRRLADHVASASDLRPCEVLRTVGLPSSWLPLVREAVAGVQRRGSRVA